MAGLQDTKSKFGYGHGFTGKWDAQRISEFLPSWWAKRKSQIDPYLGPSPTRDNPVMMFVPAAVPALNKKLGLRSSCFVGSENFVRSARFVGLSYVVSAFAFLRIKT